MSLYEHHKIIIIGGGPAGLAAALSAKEHGIDDIMILERDERLGGILNQCIHNGFGLHTFNEELTGPEYAYRYITRIIDLRIPYKLNTMVTGITSEREVTYINSDDGIVTAKADAIILAMGCRERPRGALALPGYRPAGIYTAGTAQRLMNIDGLKIGNEVVILGSGDIGLIMARRMTLEGAEVKCVVELMPYSGGLKRNIVQCLDDFDIPLKLSHTITKIHGNNRLTGVTISKVDKKRTPIPHTEEFFPCDTLLLSCGLLPENELSKSAGVKLDSVTGGAEVGDDLETSIPGIFSCGNVLHVHDLVDNVSKEAEKAGREAAAFVRMENGVYDSLHSIHVRAKKGIRYTVPQILNLESMDDTVEVCFRVDNIYRDKTLCIYYDKEKKQSIKKRIMVPSEMEKISIKKNSLDTDIQEITIRVED